jgi:hypothetical protein
MSSYVATPARGAEHGTIAGVGFYMKTFQLLNSAFALLFAASAVAPLAAFAAPGVPPPYDKLNLAPDQAQRIQQLDADWKQNYMNLGPRLRSAQSRLTQLLASPTSDPLEVTSQQQRVNQLKETLAEQATTNYLRKRRLLNSDQRQQLEGYLRRMVAERTRNKL